MGININGTSVDKVVFNGTEVEKVIFNGTVVYEKGTKMQFTCTTDANGYGSFMVQFNLSSVIGVSVTGDENASWLKTSIGDTNTLIEIYSSLKSKTVEVIVTISA